MPVSEQDTDVQPLQWIGDAEGYLRLIDQTQLPHHLTHVDCRTVQQVWHAIKTLQVRGAPAIGIAAAYGMVIALQPMAQATSDDFRQAWQIARDYLASSRPTAVNLFWALDRIDEAGRRHAEQSPPELIETVLRTARQIHEDDRQVCHAIGRVGAELLADGDGVLTHCNAGGLATSEYGTALSVLFTAQDQGKTLQVFVDETRPLLQGSRLTAWELQRRQIAATLICDSMAAQVMREGKVQAVITGADRIAANGDSANKIGTYGVAVLAAAHQIPFYIAAPRSTFDLTLSSGDQIPIEERSPEEITHGFGRATAPAGIHVYNPAFDVTPASYIRGIITEVGLIQPVSTERIREMIAGD